MFGINLSIGQAVAWAIAHRAAIAAVGSAAIKYGPTVIKIVKDGGTAIAAATKAAPELIPHIRELAGGLMQYLPKDSTATVDEVAEHVARSTFVPGWTDSETEAWWDHATGDTRNN